MTLETPLFTTPATAQALARANVVVILVGSYDGSGNFGDLIQLDAALELLGRLGPAPLVLPVLERANLAGHGPLTEQFLQPPAHSLYFDTAYGGTRDGLVPAPAPSHLTFAAYYLYGGGYLNAMWGKRKLAMLDAAESLLGASDDTSEVRLSSGLQIDAGWLADLGPREVELLRSFDLVGVRDGQSAAAVTPLTEHGVVESGDDAIGVLRRWAALPRTAATNGKLHVNLHLVDHEWVTTRPHALLGFYTELLDELARATGASLVAHPVIAYDDQRISERASLDRLSRVCSRGGIEVAAPLVLRPAGLASAVPALREAALTVSCSYHVALTTLFLGIPTVVVRDNAYYDQKMTELAEAFGLPRAFSVRATGDARATAQALADEVLDARRREGLSRRLAEGARTLRRNRADIEVELLGRLASGALIATTGRIEDLAECLRQRSAEPAELLAQLSFLRSEYEEALHNARTPGVALNVREALEESRAALAVERHATSAEQAGRLAAERRVHEAEKLLAMVVGSKSWAITSPLRRANARLRRS